MDKSRMLRIIVAVLCAVAALSLALGVYGLSIRVGDREGAILDEMRKHALLVATGEGAVESFVATAKKEAVEKARSEGASMPEIRDISAKAEEEARASTSNSLIVYSEVDTKPLEGVLDSLRAAMAEYSAEEAAAHAAYAEQNASAVIETPEGTDILEEVPPPIEGELPGGLDDMVDLSLEASEEPKIDLTGFVATAEMIRREGVVDEKFDALAQALKGIYPALDDAALSQLKPLILPLIYQRGDHYTTEYDRYVKAGGMAGLKEGRLTAMIIRYGELLLAVGVALIIMSMMVLFHSAIERAVGLPLIIIGSFFMLLCVLSVALELSITGLLSNAIVRMGMNSVMVLAMMPAIQCGISLNLGLPVGIIGGLIGGLLCIEYGFSGWWGFLFANVVGLIISAIFGYLYSLLLNRLKGSEMAVTTYVGFSVVSLMCVAWLILPFKSLVLKWPLGDGLRQTISLEPAFQYLLDRFLAFKVGGITVPTGLLLFMLIACFSMWLFTRSKTGIAMQAVGNNPRFAEATGINVDKMRIIGTMLSTMLGAVGILVYSQSYGFIQLYAAPRTLGLIAASAILIGGATTSRARISHVLIGTFLFHGVLTLGMPVANGLMPGSTVAETIRVLMSNGIILYALTKSGGGSRA